MRNDQVARFWAELAGSGEPHLIERIGRRGASGQAALGSRSLLSGYPKHTRPPNEMNYVGETLRAQVGEKFVCRRLRIETRIDDPAV